MIAALHPRGTQHQMKILQQSQLCLEREDAREPKAAKGDNKQGMYRASRIPVREGCCIFPFAALHDEFQKGQLIPGHIVDAVDGADIHCLTHSLCIISPLRRDASPPKIFLLYQEAAIRVHPGHACLPAFCPLPEKDGLL